MVFFSNLKLAYIIPPIMPGSIPGAPIGASGSGLSAITASVVKISEATLAAFAKQSV